MEFLSRILRREKRDAEICFFVQEENENFCIKIMRNLQFPPISRRVGILEEITSSENIRLPWVLLARMLLNLPWIQVSSMC